MAAPRPLPQPQGKLAENIVHFARALRRAGVGVGPAQVQTAVQAVAAVGFARKTDFYHILRATLINRAEHLETFHQVFMLFWRDPEFIEHMIRMMSPLLRTDPPDRDRGAADRRARDAMGGPDPEARQDVPLREEVTLDAQATASASEKLGGMDFEQMSSAELAEATRAVRALRLAARPLPLRRSRPSVRPTGKADLRATLAQARRTGGEIGAILRRAPATRPPDLVAICDISGSMAGYSRILMQFFHAVAHTPGQGWGRVSAFTFGTRLTNVTRALRLKDPDQALAAAGRAAQDWEGGTRIAEALHDFNRDWSRRVMSRGAVVILVTDGLERGDTAQLSHEIERLHLSARSLIWLNPLLRYDAFAPKAAGIRAMLPHVDHFHACHSLESLQQLAAVLSPGAPRPLGLRKTVA